MPQGARAVSRVGRTLSAPLAIATLALGTAAADAAQRYSTPSGAGSSCTSASPCSIVTAVNSSSAGDEVVVGPGTYTIATQLTSSAGNVTIHGAGGVPPLIRSSALNGLVLTGAGSAVRDLRIDGTEAFNGLAVLGNSRAERVDVRTSALAACGAGLGALIRDSLCLSTGANAAAVSLVSAGTDLATLRNVTAVATDPTGAALLVDSPNNTTNTVDARNVIAQGTPTDIRTRTTATASTAVVALAYSNYDLITPTGAGVSTVTPPGSGTNQTASPIFLDPFGGDLRAAPESPTVDAGSPDAFTGSIGLDGLVRPQGSAIDIGAYETSKPPPPPTDTTPPRTKITRKPKFMTKSRRARLEFTSSEPNSTFMCRLDGKPGVYRACISPQKAKRLRRGRHRFLVFAIDPAGNADPTPDRHYWRIHKRLRK